MAIVNGYIKNTSGQPVPFATVSVYDAYFEATGEAVAANAAGYFSINIDLSNEPYALGISSVGYQNVSVKLPGFVNGSTITMQSYYKDLDPVVVSSSKKNKWDWVLALIGVAVVLNKK